jgi:hypothetical protein
MSKKRIVVIDGDIVAYRCAAANEKRSIKATHKTTGQVITCPHRTALKAQIDGLFEITEFDIEDVQTPDEISFAYNSIKTTINALVKSCEADEYEVYLSGTTNFRDSLPLPSKYKGNRDDLMRPLQLKDCKSYLIRKHGAVVVEGEEADDKIASRQWEGLRSKTEVTIAATQDKDANGSEGWLYNWAKMDKPVLIRGLGELELDEKKVLRGTGRLWFYAQWLKGDAVDGFKPCELSGKKFGDTGCYNLLKDCKTDKEAIQVVYNQYLKWYPKPVTYKAWDGTEHTKDAIQLMDLYAACTHMRRYPGDVFNTWKLLETLGIDIDC